MKANIERVGSSDSYTMILTPEDGDDGTVLREFATLVQGQGMKGYTTVCSGFDYMRPEVKFTLIAPRPARDD